MGSIQLAKSTSGGPDPGIPTVSHALSAFDWLLLLPSPARTPTVANAIGALTILVYPADVLPVSDILAVKQEESGKQWLMIIGVQIPQLHHPSTDMALRYVFYKRGRIPVAHRDDLSEHCSQCLFLR